MELYNQKPKLRVGMEQKACPLFVKSHPSFSLRVKKTNKEGLVRSNGSQEEEEENVLNLHATTPRPRDNVPPPPEELQRKTLNDDEEEEAKKKRRREESLKKQKVLWKPSRPEGRRYRRH